MAEKSEKIKKEVVEEPIVDDILKTVVEKQPVIEEAVEIVEEKAIKETVRVAVIMNDKLIAVNSRKEGVLIPLTKEHKNVKVGDYINI